MKYPFHSLRLATLLAAALLAGAPATAQPTLEKATVKNIVLVHGAWADGSGWQRVHDLLHAKGYAVSNLFFDAAVFPQAFAQDLPPGQGAFLAAAQIPPAAAAFEAKVSQAAWRTRTSWYVLSTEDRIIPPAAQRKMAGRAKASIREVRGSHAIYVSQPDAVAEAIDEAARTSGSMRPGGAT